MLILMVSSNILAMMCSYFCFNLNKIERYCPNPPSPPSTGGLVLWKPDRYGKAAFEVEATYFCDETSTMYDMDGDRITTHKEKCQWDGTWTPNKVTSANKPF